MAYGPFLCKGEHVQSHRIPAEGLHGEGGYEPGGAFSHDNRNLCTLALEFPNQVGGLVGADSSGHPQKNIFSGQ